MITDPKTIFIALLGGIIPSLFWLWFWLKEEEKKPEPKGLITVIFIMGMISVIVILPIQRYIQSIVSLHEAQILLWAAVEELIKYLAVVVVVWKSSHLDEPVDWPILLITSALGFAALENTMFLIKPLSVGDTTVGLLTGQLRFLGSTLLHVVSSGVIGIGLGLAFHMSKARKFMNLILAIACAVALHAAFNFFIIRNEGSDFLKVLGFLWVATIVMLLLFEKVRRISGEN